MVKKNEIVSGILYSIEFWIPAFVIAIMFAIIRDNYLPASCFVFGVIKVFGNSKPHFFKNRFIKFILKKYPYSIKVLLMLVLVVTIALSAMLIESFVCSVLVSFCWTEYMKLLTKKESLI